MNNLSKFGNTPDKPFHSSSYAEVANGGSIGSTNSQTFGQRYRADQNRQAIRKYRDSYIGQGGLRNDARTGLIARTAPLQRMVPNEPTRQEQNSKSSLPVAGVPTKPPVTRASFKEPPTRGFNPYG